jgi:hypothetical protein
MIKSTCSILFFVSIIITACKDEEPVLTGCCENPGISTIVGNSHVYVPNIFTPNGDGHNDEFLILGDSIERIALMEIRNKDNEVVFTKTNFSSLYDGWEGEVNGAV